MKRIISFVIVLALIMGCIASVCVSAEETTQIDMMITGGEHRITVDWNIIDSAAYYVFTVDSDDMFLDMSDTTNDTYYYWVPSIDGDYNAVHRLSVTAFDENDNLIATSDVIAIQFMVMMFDDFGLYGDTDLDWMVTVLDATVIQRYLAEIDRLSAAATDRADVDHDYAVTVLDATLIQRFCAMDYVVGSDAGRQYWYGGAYYDVFVVDAEEEF